MFTGIFVIILVGIVADAITKIARSRASSRGVAALQAEVDDLRSRLDEQTALLADAEETVGSHAQQLDEVQQRLDFAERLLAQSRQKPALGAGPPN